MEKGKGSFGRLVGPPSALDQHLHYPPSNITRVSAAIVILSRAQPRAKQPSASSRHSPTLVAARLDPPPVPCSRSEGLVRVKAGKAPYEHMFSGLVQIADIGSTRLRDCRGLKTACGTTPHLTGRAAERIGNEAPSVDTTPVALQ